MATSQTNQAPASQDSPYQKLVEWVRGTSLLQSTSALLEWDQQTKLPALGGDWRTEQLTFLAGQIHQRETDPRIGDWLNDIESSEPFSDLDRQAVVRECRKDFDKKTKLPKRLVEALARACAQGQQVWVQARKDDDFGAFAPSLAEIFQLKREYAEAVGYPDCPYDALLDDFEPGALTKDVEQVLDGLKTSLIPLIARIADTGAGPDTGILHRSYPVDAQECFCRQVSAEIGFDYEAGRLDVTHHPFCETMGPHDVRLTTRYDPNFFNSAFFGTLHEAGHGIYEQGLRAEYFGLAPGSYCSLGIHESQSRMWENLVGRSKPFWEHYFSQAQTCFPAALGDVSRDAFHAAINQVQPSLIRVEADEATYNLHIIIRFELERAMLSGELPINELPAAWNQKYLDYLGIEPDSDANGALQDIHWSAGLVGYFPTYSLGNLYASQLFEAAQAELGDLFESFRLGKFADLKRWLNEKVHAPGHVLSPPNLVRQVTGENVSAGPLLRHLEATAAEVYGL